MITAFVPPTTPAIARLSTVVLASGCRRGEAHTNVRAAACWPPPCLVFSATKLPSQPPHCSWGSGARSVWTSPALLSVLTITSSFTLTSSHPCDVAVRGVTGGGVGDCSDSFLSRLRSTQLYFSFNVLTSDYVVSHTSSQFTVTCFYIQSCLDICLVQTSVLKCQLCCKSRVMTQGYVWDHQTDPRL